MCIADPRDEEEVADVEVFTGWAADKGIGLLPVAGPTLRRGGHTSQIDSLGAPEAEHWKWSGALRWYGGISDHACLVATRGAKAASTARHCTPRVLACVPPQAFARLRGRYRLLERMFGSSGSEEAREWVPPEEEVPHAMRGELLGDDPPGRPRGGRRKGRRGSARDRSEPTCGQR